MKNGFIYYLQGSHRSDRLKKERDLIVSRRNNCYNTIQPPLIKKRVPHQPNRIPVNVKGQSFLSISDARFYNVSLSTMRV